MAKICKHESCGNPVFSDGYCRFHLMYSEKYQLKAKKKAVEPLSKVKRYVVPKISNKRLELTKKYNEICEQIDQEAKESNNWKCFFCGEEFEKGYRPDHHHLKGRIGKLITEKKYIVLAHRLCHSDFHSLSTCLLVKKEWYDSFLNRLKGVDVGLYNKQISKHSK